ncbi:MAG: kinase, partial [Rhodobacteraceae bacterium]|nr:kinase [Paracoccaceae bacterium]
VAARLALGLAGLGVRPVLLAALGRDGPGRALARHLTRAGVETAHLYRSGHATGAYVAIEGPGALHAAVADCAALEEAGDGLLAPLLSGAAGHGAGALVLDGNLPGPTLAAALRAGGGAGTLPVWAVGASPAKAARLRPHLGTGRLSLALNRAEAEALVGRALADAAHAARALLALGAARALVTDGPRACADAVPGALQEAQPTPTRAACIAGLTGAGDAFFAAHLAATLSGACPANALTRGLAAAAAHIATDRTA